MRGLALPRTDWWLAAAGAALLVLAYPPFHLFVPSFVCLVPAVWLLHHGMGDPRPLRRHLVQGFWFGLLSQGLVLYWMIVALWHFTKLSAAGYIATVVALGLWSAVLFALVGWVHRRTRLSLLVIFPILWTAVEWLIGHQGDVRFPWLGLGTSLTGYPVVVQIADLVGARGVTLLLVAANTALALAWLRRRDRGAVQRLAAGVVVGLVLAAGYGAFRMRTLPLRSVGTVAAIQPAIGFREKWDAALKDSIVNELLELSQRALVETQPDLVVWPEAAVPDVLPWYPQWETRIRAQAIAAATPLVVGGLDAQVFTDRSFEYYNAAFVFDAAGRRERWPAYHKNYLVPIVERVPFVNPRRFSRLRWFGGAGKGEPGPVYEVATGKFGILICYESAFEHLTRRYRRLGADFAVNITNDAWFGRTSAPYQHAAHLVMRAIENRVGIARAANTGISEFVDPLGRQHARTALGDRTLVAGEVVTSDLVPLYARLGDWVGTLALATALGLCAAAWWRKPA